MARAVAQAFERFQRERTAFASTIADLAKSPQNVEALQQAGVMSALRPLLLDTVPSVQQAAAKGLGHLANYSDELAAAVVNEGVLPHLVHGLAATKQNRWFKRSAADALKAVAKHSAPLAKAVADAGAVAGLVACLEDFDPGVKERAAWALGYIASHTPELAQLVVAGGAVSLLRHCLQEPELGVKKTAAAALADLAKHTPELAQLVVDAGAVEPLVAQLSCPDLPARRAACQALAALASHGPDLAEAVVAAEAFPKAFLSLKAPDDRTRREAATLVREVVKHRVELAQVVVAAGGLGALVDATAEAQGNARLPGLMALGFIAAFSETLAQAVLAEKGLAPMVAALTTEKAPYLRSAAAFAISQVGRHTPDHAKAVAEAGALPALVAAEAEEPGDEDLRNKARRALKAVVAKLTHLPSLDALIHRPLPEALMVGVATQLGKVLASDAAGRALFAHSGGLAAAQTLGEAAGPGTPLAEAVQVINSSFPEEIVRYYSPGYSQALLQKLDAAAATATVGA